jgi:hypothetical protein
MLAAGAGPLRCQRITHLSSKTHFKEIEVFWFFSSEKNAFLPVLTQIKDGSGFPCDAFLPGASEMDMTEPAQRGTHPERQLITCAVLPSGAFQGRDARPSRCQQHPAPCPVPGFAGT